jgi:hypothetical protein
MLEGRQLVSITAGPALEPVLLSLGRQPDCRTETGRGSFSKNWAEGPNDFRIHRLAGTACENLDLAPTSENFHFVQPLPGGRWLLVRSRADGEADYNAHVHGADGSLVASFYAGDGIADVQATDQGHCWISYFDEGVFGDLPLGGNGLVCLAQNGRPVFRFGDLADPVVRSMADCYALNVCSGKEVWLCYYTDFPMVQLIEGTIAGWWPMSVHGSHAFAVHDGRVLVVGGYDHRDSLFVGELGSSSFQELTPVDEATGPLGQFRAFGRHHLLFLATEEALRVVDLRSL